MKELLLNFTNKIFLRGVCQIFFPDLKVFKVFLSIFLAVFQGFLVKFFPVFKVLLTNFIRPKTSERISISEHNQTKNG